MADAADSPTGQLTGSPDLANSSISSKLLFGGTVGWGLGGGTYKDASLLTAYAFPTPLSIGQALDGATGSPGYGIPRTWAA